VLKGAKGFTYTGEFKDGNMHGKGDYRYSNGDRYVGMIKPNALIFATPPPNSYITVSQANLKTEYSMAKVSITLRQEIRWKEYSRMESQ